MPGRLPGNRKVLGLMPGQGFCYCCFLGQETSLPLPQPPAFKPGHIVYLHVQGTAEKQPLADVVFLLK